MDSEQAQLPLIDAYPALAGKIPHIKLASLPTPIKRLSKLEIKLTIGSLNMKDDSLTSSKFGGNKTRKLEFLIPQAMENEAPAVVTQGSISSNHCAATAIMCAKEGIPCVLCYIPQQGVPTEITKRNLLLALANNAQMLHFSSADERIKGIETINKTFINQHGKAPYFIPQGGSNYIGDIAYVNAAFELKNQIDRGLSPMPDTIYITCGSGGSTAGLTLGCALAGLPCNIVGVRVAHQDYTEQKFTFVKNLIREINEHLHKLDQSIPIFDPEFLPLIVRHEFYGPAYSVISPESALAVSTVYEEEKIHLDGTYTGKTFSAIMRDASKGLLRTKNILFWNTFFPDCLEDQIPTYTDLPKVFHQYFNKS